MQEIPQSETDKAATHYKPRNRVENQKNNKHTLFWRPSPNERTCMGWHKRYALALAGAQGTLRPEALNLEAWFSCSGTHKQKTSQR